MNTIKFSHNYSKMDYDNTTKAGLMQLFVCDAKELSEAFVKYDTKYYENGEAKYYDLPKGKVIVLLLLDEDNFIFFTSIRRWTPEREKDYRECIGKMMGIEVSK